MLDKPTQKYYSRDMFLLLVVLIAEKPIAQKYDTETGRSSPVALLVIMRFSCRRDIQNEAISVEECFS
jgi:hypothetical protein